MLIYPSKIRGILYAAICLWLSAYSSAEAGFSSDSTVIPSPTVTPMQQVTIPQQPSWNDINSAMAYSQNYATNTCQGLNASSPQTTCTAKIYVATVGQPTAQVPSCPSGYAPSLAFGSDATSPSGPVYYTQYSSFSNMTAASKSFYTSNYYTCGPDSAVAYSEAGSAWVSPYPGWDDSWNTFFYYTGLYPIPYFAMTAGAQYYPNTYTTLRSKYMYLTAYSYTYTMQCIQSGSGNVVGSGYCSNGYAGYYWRYTFYIWYTGNGVKCTRNAGWYPAPTGSTYPTATVYNIYSPTTTICGKRQSTWSAKPTP